MGFQIVVNTGDYGPVTLRGCDDGGVEMCDLVNTKNPITKEVVPTLVATRWYADISQAFRRVTLMRIASADAKTLKELVKAIKVIHQDIQKEMGAV